MAQFLHHESCPSCGSKDNLARYSDGGSFCFGCHYTERATRYVPKSDVKKEYEKVPELSHDFPPDIVEWVLQYGLSLEEIIARGVGYGKARHQLVFTFPQSNCWQARNFANGAKSKYFTQGDINELIPIYPAGHDAGRLVVVEDCISAIKCARQFDAMPVLGSHVSLAKLSGISKLYKEVIIWLDADKYKEACRLSEQAKLIGLNSKVVYTELDPKEHDNVAIQKRVE